MNTFQQDIYKKTVQEITKLAQEYRSPVVPIELSEKAKVILDAADSEMAWALSKKVIDRALICFLAMWAQKKIPGRLTLDSLEKDIKKQETLAKFLQDRGQEKAYVSQLNKIDALKKQLKELLGSQKV